MATLGMAANKALAEGGAAPEVTPGLEFFNTGVALVTGTPADGVDSISVADGQAICWGGGPGNRRVGDTAPIRHRHCIDDGAVGCSCGPVVCSAVRNSDSRGGGG
jgi:hypothetical protein